MSCFTSVVVFYDGSSHEIGLVSFVSAYMSSIHFVYQPSVSVLKRTGFQQLEACAVLTAKATEHSSKAHSFPLSVVRSWIAQ